MYLRPQACVDSDKLPGLVFTVKLVCQIAIFVHIHGPVREKRRKKKERKEEQQAGLSVVR